MIKPMSQPNPASEEDPDKEEVPNLGTWIPPEAPELPKPGTPEYQKMMDAFGGEDQTSAALQLLEDLRRLSK
jgi:hypothetical protein